VLVAAVRSPVLLCASTRSIDRPRQLPSTQPADNI
jgi:hypothetical protein